MRRSTGGGVVAGVVALALGACQAPAANEHGGSPERPDEQGVLPDRPDEHGVSPERLDGAGRAEEVAGKGDAIGPAPPSPIAAGHLHSCVLASGGNVYCWGRNSYGQLGDGTTIDRATPVPVLQSPGGPPLEGVQALASGTDHSCATVSGGQVLCWGRNDFGELGDGTTVERLTPVAVALP